MGLFKDDHTVQLNGSTIAVTGATGLVHATWTLSVDGTAVDSAEAAGTFTLRGNLPDGSALRATVFQSLLGPTEVAIEHEGTEIARFTGFVA
ncbi:MAG: hypothetical protein ABWZ98_02265 [Nakamurella sp.]